MEETHTEIKPIKEPKPFTSVAQMDRLRRLAAEGDRIYTQERFEADLAITNVSSLPTAEKAAVPYKSLAQARRCDSLVEAGSISREIFERDLMATNIEAIPWRAGPLKPEDPDEAGQEEFRAKLAARQSEIGQGGRHGFAGVEALIILMIIGFVFLGLFGLPSYRCHAKTGKMGLPGSYSVTTGCMVRTGKGWIPLENFRHIDD